MASKSEAERVKDIRKRHDALKLRRQKFEPAWQQIAELVVPQLADFEVEGARPSDDIGYQLETAFDPTGRHAVRTATNGYQGWLTPRSQPFQRMGVLNETIKRDPQVKRWLRDGESALYAEYDNSNFYDTLGVIYEVGFTIATACMTITEDRKRGRLVYTPRHPKSTWIAEDNYRVVDTMYDLRMWTWRQIEQEFGDSKLDAGQKNRIKDSPYEETEVLRVCVPREDRIAGKRDNLNMPYAVYWILLDSDTILRESGYRFMHDIAWRFRPSFYDPYGFGPSWDAFLALRRGDKFSETLLRAADYSVRPAVQYTGKDRDLDLSPAGMNAIRDIAAKVEKIDLVGEYPIGVDWYDRNVKAIEEYYHTRVFQAITESAERQRTAFEVDKIAGEQAAIMQAEVGRTESELLDPTSEATIRMLVEAGRFPEPPDVVKELAGGIKFEYITPLAQLQREHHKVQDVQRFLRNVIPILQISQEAGDWTDWDKLYRQTMEDSGLDAERAEQEVRILRQARAKAQQEAGSIASAKELSEVAENLDTPVKQQVFSLLRGSGAA